VRDIAAKAQTRLCGRYRALSNRGKMVTVAVTAIARELAGSFGQSEGKCSLHRPRRSPSAAAHSVRMGGGGATAEEFPSDALWPVLTDAHSKTGNASDEYSEMR
jgi:transposase